jgi:PASTA domain
MTERGATSTTLPPTTSRASVAVGDYLDTPAAAAVRAVRRVGLSPGLERQFGGEAQTIGLVVAQDPPPGSKVARGAIVTLYVSARTPGAGEPQQQPQHPTVELRQGHAAGPAGEAEAGTHASTATPSAIVPRPRRKRRARAAPGTEHEQEHARIGARSQQHEAMDERDDRPRQIRDREPDASSGQAEPRWEELTFEMRNIFQRGALAASRRGLYPHKPLRLRMRTCLTWLDRHKAMAIAGVGVLALALSLTIAHGHTVSATRAGSGARSVPASSASTAPVGHASSARASHADTTTREHRRAHARHSPRPPARGATATASAANSAYASTEAPAPTDTAASAGPAQSGGPFSP